MKTLAFAVMLLAIVPAGAGGKPPSVVELPRPSSGTFSVAQVEARKSEILSNTPTPKLEAWKNPYTGFCVHVHQDDTLTIYRQRMAGSQQKERATWTVAEIKQAAAEIPLYGSPAGILITSDVSLKNSKVFTELLNALFIPYFTHEAANPRIGAIVDSVVDWCFALQTLAEWLRC